MAVESIFLDAGDVELTQEQEKGIVGFLIAFVFLLMAFEIVDPDVAFFGALIVCLFTGILDMVNTALSLSSCLCRFGLPTLWLCHSPAMLAPF